MIDSLHDNQFKKFILSVAQGIRQQQNNNTYGHVSEIQNIDDLMQAVQFDHVGGIFKDNHRSVANFIQADVIIMDCDNEKSDNPNDWLTPDKLSERIPNVPFCISYSRNHMKAKETKSARLRFHVYLPLNKKYSQADLIRLMKEKLLRVIPEFDSGAKDTARFFYGVDNPQCELHEGSICIDEFLDTIPDFELSENELDTADADANISAEHEDFDSAVIPVGERNKTTFDVAMKALGKYGISQKARDIFDNACSRCKPPLPLDEINRTWNQATTYAKDFKDKRDNSHEMLMMMRDDFLEGKHIFFHGTIKGGSFYEYQPAGFWARLTDASMQSKLSEHFRHSKSNRDIANLSMMIRLMTTKHSLPKFNSKRLWLLQNGVFDFNTGELRQPKPDDFLTWQVEYGYDAEATCPLFDKFLAECANHEPSRIDFLTDLLGYIPYENNRLERIFFLIGEGNNGKSTFLHVLEHLIRNKNEQYNSQSVTHIQPSMFDKPTELMQLEGSIINIAYDIYTNLKGCEAALKSVASGDVISGNHKFCDTVSFRPRCKLIFSSNHMIKVNDDSFGMRRKLMFCKFENNFTGHEDTHLEEKLIAELPGIFNKMFRAYKALLEREKELNSSAIRPCIDNDEFITEFSQTANPVAAFWNEFKDDFLSRGEIKKSEIFDTFIAFCNGKFAGDVRQFFKNLKKVASYEGITINDTRHRENGGQIYYCQFINSATTETTAHKDITLDDVLNADSLVPEE